MGHERSAKDLELLDAIDRADLATIGRLLDGGVALEAPAGETTPLHYAVDFGGVDVIDFLIQRGANIEARNRNDLTPLMMACLRGGDACARAADRLVDAGADVKAVRRSDWCTPLGAAVGPGVLAIAFVQKLIDRGAEVNGPAGNDWPPLMDAVKANYLDAMKLLMACGARLDAPCLDSTVVEQAEAYDCVHAPVLRAALAGARKG